jgi:protein-tyrosine phosphatase
VPEISVKGTTPNAITIGWSSSPQQLKDHVHYYELVIFHNKTKKQAFHPANMMNLYLFDELQSATTYYFQVRLKIIVPKPGCARKRKIL